MSYSAFTDICVCCVLTVPDDSHHVHFPADQVQAHDAEIVIQPVGDGQLNVHLGFLQIHHHYQVQLVIKDTLSEDLKFDPLQNLHVNILEAVPTDDGKHCSHMIHIYCYSNNFWHRDSTKDTLM